MVERFKEKDLGSRIELEFDPLKVDEQFYASEPGYVKVPYDAIENYKLLVKSKYQPGIKVTGKALPEINPIHIAKFLGANSVTVNGIIIELAETYVKIKKSPRIGRMLW